MENAPFEVELKAIVPDIGLTIEQADGLLDVCIQLVADDNVEMANP